MNPELVAAELRPTDGDLLLREAGSTRPVHIVGIGGAGMRAIARVFADLGHLVSGSDKAASPHIDALVVLGVDAYVGSNIEAIGALPSNTIVTRSTAVPDNDPEIQAAFERDLQVVSRASALRAISATRRSILVAGTHGKTTTSSLLSVLLDHASASQRCDSVSSPPGFVVGADIDFFGTGARWPQGELAVIEADESDGTFLSLVGEHAIVTSLDPDHLEFYGSRDRLNLAFEAFVDSVPGVCAVFADDPDTAELVGRSGVVTYGTAGTDLELRAIQVERGRTTFDVIWRGDHLGSAAVGLAGVHNAYNAAGALALSLELGVPFAVAATGLSLFTGVQRRYEWRGHVDGVTFIDDYAHLPAEVEAALATASAGGWNRVVATYQPHRYSRTEAHGHEFGQSFADADQLVLTDIYPSGEAPRPGVSGQILVDAVRQAEPDRDIAWQASLDDVADFLDADLQPGDLCLTLGAGDLTTVPDVVIARRRASGPSRREALAGELERILAAGCVTLDAPLGARTTYRVGGTAAVLAEVGSVAELQLVAEQIGATRVPAMLVGRGSNLLVSDAGFDGVVVALGESFEDVSVEGDRVIAGGAAFMPVVARRSVADGLSGFEWAVGVPGSIGGAVAMNAGGHGSDMAASLTEATTIHLRTGRARTWTTSELAFGYRESAISADHCVVRCVLGLETASDSEGAVDGAAMLSEIVKWRREHQPGGQNAGSVFTNPPGDSAGRLIDSSGCKGLRIGTAQVSPKHANFFQAAPSGSADDIFELMHVVYDRVLDATGIALQPETRLVGFEPFRARRRGTTAKGSQ